VRVHLRRPDRGSAGVSRARWQRRPDGIQGGIRGPGARGLAALAAWCRRTTHRPGGRHQPGHRPALHHRRAHPRHRPGGWRGAAHRRADRPDLRTGAPEPPRRSWRGVAASRALRGGHQGVGEEGSHRRQDRRAPRAPGRRRPRPHPDALLHGALRGGSSGTHNGEGGRRTGRDRAAMRLSA